MLNAPSSGQPAPEETATERNDHLQEHPEGWAIALGAIAILLVIASVAAGFSGGLPTIAFGWTFGLEIVRAAVVFAVFAVITIVIVRGWSGVWPQSISTTSIDYGKLSEAKVGLDQESARLNALRDELRDEQRAMTQTRSG